MRSDWDCYIMIFTECPGCEHVASSQPRPSSIERGTTYRIATNVCKGRQQKLTAQAQHGAVYSREKYVRQESLTKPTNCLEMLNWFVRTTNFGNRL
jgi:hypothetical protein